ncbi:MAG: hypothetical protein OEX22_03250 [Cyclobacteriaceae bacterium]|nr:hypothetical protein [Cyclobacteriaceae bacterium]
MKLLKRVQHLVWSLLIAFMVGMHNFYHQEYNSPDDLKQKIECIKKIEDNANR